MSVWALELQGRREQRGSVDVGIAVDLAVAEEVGVLEAGDQAEDAGLLAELHVVLEADEVEALGAEILLAKLDAGLGPAAGPRVVEAHGFMGPKRRVSRPRRAISSMGRQPSK